MQSVLGKEVLGNAGPDQNLSIASEKNRSLSKVPHLKSSPRGRGEEVQARLRPIAAASEKLLNELGYIGGIEGAVERLKAQDEAGVDVHQVEIEATGPAEFERIVAKLL